MSRRAVRRSIAAALLVLALVFAAPFFEIDWLKAPVRAGLKNVLAREVRIGGPVRVRLIPSPGVIVENVMISDEAAFGIEPFAYVPELEATVDLLALFWGRLAFRGLALVGPSMNLVKNGAGQWNYQSLLQRVFAAAAPGRAALLQIEVQRGRLNFKFGNRKSVFYLSDADIAVSPEAGDGPALRFRFSASPSRTDRAAQGFGRFSGNGRFAYGISGQHRLRMVVRLERSAIAELLTLFGGHGTGLGGFLASRAEFEGPLSRVRILGELQLADVDQRFILPPRSGEWALNYEGTLDLVRQEVRLQTRPRRERLPVSIRFFCADYLTRPRWAFLATTERLPLETIPALASELGVPLFTGLQLRGLLSGAVGRSAEGRVQGRFRATGVELSAPGGEKVRVAAATATATDDLLSVEPARVILEGREAATVSGSYSREAQELHVVVGARGFPVERFVSLWKAMAGAAPPRAFSFGSGGSWTGVLHFQGSPGRQFWSGNVALQDRRLAVPGLENDVRILRAETDAAGREIRLEARVGAADFRAHWQEPDRLDLECTAAAVEELERQLRPSLSWGPAGLIARALGLRRAKIPRWLARRRLEGSFAAEILTAGRAALTAVKARYYWTGPALTVHLDAAAASPGKLTGILRADLAGGTPRWTATGRLAGLRWDGAEVEAAANLTAEGTSVAALASLRAEGEFSARFPEPAAGLREAGGCFEFRMARLGPEFRLPCLRLRTEDGAALDGWGRVDARGRLRLELFDPGGWYEAAGRLEPLELTIRRAASPGIE